MDSARYEALVDPRNSFDYWGKVCETAAVPSPDTKIFTPSNPTLVAWCYDIRVGNELTPDWIPDIIRLGEEIGYPLFMRTSEGSSKHSGEETCLVRSPEKLEEQLNLMLFKLIGSGLPEPESVVLRELLIHAPVNINGVVAEPFRAFGPKSRLPIGAERRYTVNDGDVICHHPYWPEEAITGVDPKVPNWRDRLCLLNHESVEEVDLLSSYARSLSKLLDGLWCVDFMWSTKGWMFIDAGLALCCEHPRCEAFEVFL